MPNLHNLTVNDFRDLFSFSSLNQASGYLNAISSPVRSGQTLKAKVQGSRLYDVEVVVRPDTILAHCTCPYDWGGYCKHVGAVLLKWIQNPGVFAVQAEDEAAEASGLKVIPVDPPPVFQPEALPQWMVLPFDKRQRANDDRLYSWLEDVKMQDLRRIAKQRRWEVKANRKADLARAIVDRMVEPEGITAAYLGLDAEHRWVLQAMAISGIRSLDVYADMERVIGHWGILKSYNQISTYTRHLWQTGLALPGEVLGEQYPSMADFIPLSIMRSLPPILESAFDTTLHPSGKVDSLVLADSSPLLRGVNHVILLLEQSAPALRPPMPRPELERFIPGLARWDYDPDELARLTVKSNLRWSYSQAVTVPPRARSLPDDVIEDLAPMVGGEARLEFIYSLLVAVGVFLPGSPVTPWPEVKAEFLRQDDMHQWALLARTYFNMAHWNVMGEVLREGKIRLMRLVNQQYFRINDLLVHLALYRHLVLRVLASLPDGRWVQLSDLFPFLRTLWPQFDGIMWQKYRAASPVSPWFVASTATGKTLEADSADDWALAQGRFIQWMITGPLHWLGLADLAFEGETLVAARFHGLGDLYWERVDLPALSFAASVRSTLPRAEDAVEIDETTITVVPTEISSQAHTTLHHVCQLESATAERFVYRLDPRVTYNSFEAGLSLPEFLESWDRELSVPMPEAMRQQLTDWWSSYGHVRLYTDLIVIEFGDDYALSEMKAVTRLDDAIVAEISPRLVIISHSAVDELVAALEAAGYMPKRVDES